MKIVICNIVDIGFAIKNYPDAIIKPAYLQEPGVLFITDEKYLSEQPRLTVSKVSIKLTNRYKRS